MNEIGHFLVAVGAIIEDPKTHKILLLKRSDDKDFSGGIWEYPMGRMNQFEEPVEALKREIKEESGLQIDIVKPISICYFFRGEKIAEKELVGIIFWCKSKTKEIVLSEEHTDFQWIEAKKALDLMSKPRMKEDISAYLREKKIKK